MKDATDSIPAVRPIEQEGFANRKLIRPSLNRGDHNHSQHWHLVRPKSDLPEIRETMALRLNVNCLLAQPQTHPATASATGCAACRVPLRRGRGRRERSS